MNKLATYIIASFFIVSSAFSQDITKLPCLKRILSVNIHIIKNEAGDPGILESTIEDRFKKLNELFEPICLDFEICSYEYIDNYHYDNLNDDMVTTTIMNDSIDWLRENQEFNDLLSKHYKKNTINVYYCSEVYPLNEFEQGLTFMPGGYDVIVIPKRSTFDVLAHEMGHYFGLYHTFETQFGLEPVIRSFDLPPDQNPCLLRGDLLCDTYADPFKGDSTFKYNPPNIINRDCQYVAETKDSIGDFYLPQANNFMSYYPSFCRNKYTLDQYRRMAEQFLVKRSYLW